MKASWMVVLCVCALFAVGCGDDGDGGGEDNDSNPDPVPEKEVCEFEACGGDPAGTWSLEGECGFEGRTDIDPECPGAFLQAEGVGLSGQSDLSFEDDGSWGLTYNLTGSFQFFVPKECLGEATCEDVEGRLHLPQSDNWACPDTGEACDCLIPTETSLNDGGVRDSWRVEGNTIIATDTDDEDQVFEFCIEGDTMTVKDGDGFVLTFSRAF